MANLIRYGERPRGQLSRNQVIMEITQKRDTYLKEGQYLNALGENNRLLHLEPVNKVIYEALHIAAEGKIPGRYIRESLRDIVIPAMRLQFDLADPSGDEAVKAATSGIQDVSTRESVTSVISKGYKKLKNDALETVESLTLLIKFDEIRGLKRS